MKRKPTRRDLLMVIGKLQDMIGTATGNIRDDKDRFGYEKGMNILSDAHELCIAALGQDPPIKPSGPWA